MTRNALWYRISLLPEHGIREYGIWWWWWWWKWKGRRCMLGANKAHQIHVWLCIRGAWWRPFCPVDFAVILSQSQEFATSASKPAELWYASGSSVSIPQNQLLTQLALVGIPTGSQFSWLPPTSFPWRLTSFLIEDKNSVTFLERRLREWARCLRLYLSQV